MSEEYPKAISDFHRLLLALPGVTNVSSGIESLAGITAGDLGLADFAHLPHAALRRTEGGLSDEVFVQIEFHLTPNPDGWRTLEFLAWFVRDQARGGESLQLRPFALPPVAAGKMQLGNTLKFHLDLFCPDSNGEIEPILARVEQMGRNLKMAIEIYRNAIYG
jgi:hypothetical protein